MKKKQVTFNAKFTSDYNLDTTCTIIVQDVKIKGSGRYYDDAMQDCFVKIRERFDKSFWQILEDNELKIAK